MRYHLVYVVGLAESWSNRVSSPLAVFFSEEAAKDWCDRRNADPILAKYLNGERLVYNKLPAFYDNINELQDGPLDDDDDSE